MNNDDLYVEASDLDLDPLSGATYPRKTTIIIDESRVKGTITYKMKHIVFRAGMPQLPGMPRMWKYLRYRSDIHAKLEIDGQKIEHKSQEIHESGI